MARTICTLCLAASLLTVGSELPVRAQVLEGGHVQTRPGDGVAFPIVLRSEGREVSALQFELPFTARYRVEPTDGGRPACQVGPAIDKPGSQFVFVPPDCSPRQSCAAVRALLFEVGEQTPIADGAQVATCVLRVAADATPGRQPIEITNFVASSPEGQRLPHARTIAGELDILPADPFLPSPTPTVEPTPSPVPCTGDCHGDGSVTIDELLLLVLDALDSEGLRCPAGDRNRDGTVTIDEIVEAVGRALEGCMPPLGRAMPVPAVACLL